MVRLPDFVLEEIEDYFVYYVHILGISETLFWNADIPFVKHVAENKAAYENWKHYVGERMSKSGRKK